jgi:hypothetical protein
MRTYQGTDTVEPGLYFNARGLSFTSIERTGPLPGDAQTFYRRVPMLAMLLLAPILGLLFVVFLPFIGFGMVAYLIGGKALQAGRSAARETVRVVRPSWEPSVAFLSRRKDVKAPADAEPPEPAVEPDDWADAVERTLDEKERHE